MYKFRGSEFHTRDAQFRQCQEGRMSKLGENVASKKNETQPMSETNLGANLMFALRTKTRIKPMFENELETFASGIGSQTIVVRGRT